MVKIIELYEGLTIKKGDDGYWMNFKTPSGNHASVNLGQISHGSIIQRAILVWAENLFKPLVKKINMSVCIESGIDMEFYSCEVWKLGRLYAVMADGQYDNGCNEYFGTCRPRMNHTHASPTGWEQCPIPEGFVVDLYFSDCQNLNVTIHSKIDWQHVIMFEVTDIAAGWEL